MLLLLLPLLASGAPSSGPCCSSKTVGGLEYTLVREDSAALSLSCLSPCVYERSGMPGLDGGPQYCFARGEQTVFCGNSTSEVAGEPKCRGSAGECEDADGASAFPACPNMFPEDGQSLQDSTGPLLFWNEYLEDLFIALLEFTICHSENYCSSTTDPIHAHVIFRPAGDNSTGPTFSDKDRCKVADRFIQSEVNKNSTGTPDVLPSPCQDGSTPIEVRTGFVIPKTCATLTATQVTKCNTFTTLFGPNKDGGLQVQCLKLTTFDGGSNLKIPLPCCCFDQTLRCSSTPNLWGGRASQNKCNKMCAKGILSC